MSMNGWERVRLQKAIVRALENARTKRIKGCRITKAIGDDPENARDMRGKVPVGVGICALIGIPIS
jgi:hypothetical protein